MRFKFGLSLFEKTSSRRTINIATFHSPNSLTWTWILRGEIRSPRNVYRFRVWNPKDRHCAVIGFGVGDWLKIWASKPANRAPEFCISLLCISLGFSSQSPMWYRDLYNRQYVENAQLEAEIRKLKRSQSFEVFQ